MKTFREFFTLGYTKPKLRHIQYYLDHLGTRLMSVKDIIKNIERHFKNIKNVKLDRLGRKVLAFEEFQIEDIKVPIKVGDTVLGGKFKNKKTVVKDIGKNEKGDLTINGRPLLKFRIMAEDLQWKSSMSQKLFDVGTRIGDVKFPMSSSIFRRVWPDAIRATVFHVTGPKEFPSVVKMQGKKKSLSAFFEMQAHYLKTGVQTKGGVVVELDANVLLSGSEDIMSAPDKSGRRWVDFSFIENLAGQRYAGGPSMEKVKLDLEKLIIQLLTTYTPGKLGRISKHKLMIDWQNLGIKLTTVNDKMAMRDVIRDYIDGVEKILKKHKDLFKELFYSYMKKRTTDEPWDEQIVNNIKIKKVHLLKEAGVWTNPTVDVSFYQFSDEVRDKYRLEVKRWMNPQSLETYIREVARTGTGSTKEAEQQKADDELEARRKEVLASFGKKK